MRDLLLLRGVPGCGKSTFIKKFNLMPYTICPDDIRLLFNCPVFDAETGKNSISQKQNQRVWKLVYELVEEKMQNGEFIVVDATNVDVSTWKKLSEQYRYKIYVKDFSDVSLETCLKQNLMRDEYKQVPEQIIVSFYEKIKSTPLPNYANKIDSMEEFLNIKPVDCNQYENIYVFGDIHGCFDPLMSFFDKNQFSEKNLYLFLGDYLDRGYQNKETIEFLIQLSKCKNVLFLEGNHNYEKYYANNEIEKIKSSEFKKNTIPQISNVDKKQIREFCRRWMQMSYFTFNGKSYFATHAGTGFFNPSKLRLIPSIDFIKGGKYEEDVDKWWNEKNYSVIQIHGHRNIYEYPVDKFETSFNLNSAVEFGDKLRVMKISKSGHDFLYFDNPSCQGRENPWKKKFDISTNVVEKMKNSGDILEKKLGNNISSFNFKRDVFFKSSWNELNSIARGLFVNTDDNSIVARSYEKFFNYQEGNKNSDDFLRENLKFPLSVYRKENGFLGLLSYNKKTDELFFASKSTDSSEFAGWFRDIAKNQWSINKFNDIKNYLKENNCTMVFEVIDMTNDPHIIEYNGNHLVLLDVIKNDFKTEKLNYDKLIEVAGKFNLEVKKLEVKIDDFDSMIDLITNGMKKINHEGFVIEDINGYMFKVKSPFYLFWKSIRKIRDDIAKEKNIDTLKLSGNQLSVYNFIMSNSGLIKKSVIDIRKEYEKKQNTPF